VIDHSISTTYDLDVMMQWLHNNKAEIWQACHEIDILIDIYEFISLQSKAVMVQKKLRCIKFFLSIKVRKNVASEYLIHCFDASDHEILNTLFNINLTMTILKVCDCTTCSYWKHVLLVGNLWAEFILS
jgi:hypothetical protein